MAAVVALLAGCSGGADGGGGTDEPSGAPSGEPVQGGTLRVAIDADPVCLDPAQATLIASNNIARQVVDSLLEQDPDTGEFVPWLAESYEVNDEATEFTYKLREGVTFSDGAEFNAEAVKAFFDGIIELGAKSVFGATYMTGYVETEIVDPMTVTVKFDGPNAQFLMASSTTTLSIQSPESMKTDPADKCAGNGIIGTGPFTIESYSPNQSVNLKVREDYDWPSAIAEHEGRAYFDEINYTIATEPSVRAGLIQSNQVDLATTIQSQDEASVDAAGWLLTRVNPGIAIGMTIDMTRPDSVFQDPAVREAVQLAMNRQEIADTVLTPNYGVVKSMLGETTPGWADFSDTLLAVDEEKAKQVLEDAGWVEGADGIREKDGKKLSASVVYFYQTNVHEYSQQILRRIGFDLKLNEVTAAQATPEYQSGNYDSRANSVSRADPDIMRAYFDPTYTTLPTFPEDLEGLDELRGYFEIIRGTTDPEPRAEAAEKAQEWLLSNNYVIPLSNLVQIIGVQDNVVGLRYDATSRFVTYDAGFTE